MGSTVTAREDWSQTSYRNPQVRGWASRLWREALLRNWRRPRPAPARPEPEKWRDDRVTAAWLGHATVLLNFYGVKILTDPVLFSRVGLRLPGFTIGPKRLTRPALKAKELPSIDLILLSHAHFDHFDCRTLRRFSGATKIVTARDTSDLLRGTPFREVTELHWRDRKSIVTRSGTVDVTAIPVRHWGARMQHDDHRGYNGYLLERKNCRLVFGADTAMTSSFREVRQHGPVDLAMMSIGCYDPWIRSHCTPEEAVQMANDAGAEFILPIHHQTFRLSYEPFSEPIERFERALQDAPHRIALREIGETFVLPE
jgi:L-ascorbate metabolism protein UlaG (beta-lactamase superfamily)